MKQSIWGGFILLLTVLVTSGCFREGMHETTGDTADSTKLISSQHEALEKAILEYYTAIEKDVSKDLGVPKTEIVKRVQSMIDEGYVKKPVILIITKDGPRWAAVDYSTYKEYMTGNAVTSRRFHGTQADILDTVFMDSIRDGLLKALESGDAPSEDLASP